MAEKDFFEDGDQEAQVPEKTKVGDKEYTQDELSALVGLGETARDIETKQNTKLDKVFPSFTKVSQENKELKDKLSEIEKEQERFKQAITGEASKPDPEALRAQALEQAKSLGIPTLDDVRQIAFETLKGKETLDEIKAINKEAETLGQPKIDTKEFLEYAQQNGLDNVPVRAIYKLRYEAELDAWKTEQLNKVKQPDFQTQTTSTAGAKVPPTGEAPTGSFSEQITRFIQSREGKEQT